MAVAGISFLGKSCSLRRENVRSFVLVRNELGEKKRINLRIQRNLGSFSDP
jgi:hypothetical protein